jgi:hypothetical protein
MSRWHHDFHPIEGSGITREPERPPAVPSEPPRQPTLTVVIPAGNAHTTLTRTIEVPGPAPAAARVRGGRRGAA